MSLQSTSDELVRLIDSLKLSRNELDKEIMSHQDEKQKIERDMDILRERLKQLENALHQKINARNEYDKTIRESEAAYSRILESSQKLVEILKQQTSPPRSTVY